MGFVLGLNGPAGAGKDTVADYLVATHGWDGKLSFAGNLKKICKRTFQLTDDDINSQEGKMRRFLKPRVLTQTHLNVILNLMVETHRYHPLRKGGKAEVLSLVGTEMRTPRRVLQLVGTDICRALIPNYHVDVLVAQIRANPNKRYIITDVRFPNEGDVVLDAFKGLVAYVDRPNPAAQNVDRTHASETAMISWGRFVDNIDNHREGLDFLYVEVDNFLEKHGLCPTQS